MKYYKYFISILSGIIILIFFCYISCTAFAIETITDKIEVTDFESFNDITLAANSMGEYSTYAEAEQKLIEKYPCIKVNNGTGSINIESWILKNESSDYNIHKIGEYIFRASLAVSDEYDTDNIFVFPSIKIIIGNPKTQIVKYEKLDDILVKTDATKGYGSLEEAEETLINKYNVVKVNDCDDKVDIEAWSILDSKEYDSAKSGTYTFIAKIKASDKYIVNIDSPKLTVNIIISEPDKAKASITVFDSLPQIQLKTTSAEGYKTEADAIVTLCILYKNINVNYSEDTIPIKGWSKDAKNTEYDSTKPGKYIFIASLGESEKYETENIAIPLPRVEVVFSLPKGTISISLLNQDNSAIINADITAYNSNYTYNGKTDYSGNCVISDVVYGNYKVIVAANNVSFNKTVVVKDGFSSDYNWVVSLIQEPAAVTTPKITTSKVTITKMTTAKETTVSEKHEETTPNTIQTENSSADSIEHQIINIADEPVKIKEMQTESGLKIEIAVDKVSDEQLSELMKMSADEINAEVQKAISAVSSINFIKTSDDARKKIANATGGLNASVLPINFTEHASFSFPVKVSVSVGKGVYPTGDGYFLYYFNPDTGLLESYGSASVDDNGVVTFTISHCSDYFLMDKEISVNNIETLPNTKNTAESQVETSTEKQISSIKNAPKTESKITVTPSNTTKQAPTKIIVNTESRKSTGRIFIIIGVATILLCIHISKNKLKKK